MWRGLLTLALVGSLAAGCSSEKDEDPTPDGEDTVPSSVTGTSGEAPPDDDTTDSTEGAPEGSPDGSPRGSIGEGDGSGGSSDSTPAQGGENRPTPPGSDQPEEPIS